MGWHNKADMVYNKHTQRMEFKRNLLPGAYPFKFVIDGLWTASADHPMYRVRAVPPHQLYVGQEHLAGCIPWQ